MHTTYRNHVCRLRSSLCRISLILVFLGLGRLSLATAFLASDGFGGNQWRRQSFHPLFSVKEHLGSVLANPEETANLPIWDILEDIISSLQQKHNLLLEAPPGAGKTSCVPLALLSLLQQDNNKKERMVMIQPRRVAARNAALRMAALLGEPVGHTVGYAIRGESVQSSSTRILVMTDGVLLSQLKQDPELVGIQFVLLDEFHERGVASDTALALVRESQDCFRPDLKIIVMSATLLGNVIMDPHSNKAGAHQQGSEEVMESAATKLVRVLGGPDECQVLQSDGRQFPITVQWANDLQWNGNSRFQPLGSLMRDRRQLVEVMCHAIEQGVSRAPASGDVLAFLPGAAEIRRTISRLEERNDLRDIEIVPLYGALSKKEQDYAIYCPPNSHRRRVIVSSPIAEASLTLQRVTCVVDSGLCRTPKCDVDTGMPRLVTTRCSQASARQRAGRAGRVQEGLCIRIYNEAEFETNFLEHAPPEIMSTDLSPTILLLADWGCSSIQQILHEVPFVDLPEKALVRKAVHLLVDMKILEDRDDERLVVTPEGRKVSAIPAHPRFANSIVRARKNPCDLAAALSVAFLMDGETGVRGGGYDSKNSADLSYQVRHLFETSKVEDKKALLRYASRIGKDCMNCVESVLTGDIPLKEVISRIGPVMIPGFVDLIAERKGDSSYGGSAYMLSLGRSARLDDIQDGPEFIVVLETTTGDDGKARIRSFASVSKETLLDMAEEKDVVFTVPSRGHEVRARRVLGVGSLELRSSPLPTPSGEEVCRVLKRTIRDLGGVHAFLIQSASADKRDLILEFCNKIRLATSLSTHEEWPDFVAALDAEAKGEATEDQSSSLEELVEPWLASAGSLKKLDLYQILTSHLSMDLVQHLEKYYPSRLEAPDGSKIPVKYSSYPPTASGKLQQFFGATESPTVGPPENSIAVSLSLLSPSGKTLAQTIDLPFFWKESYPSVRAEMRGRYAKHPWPEDPLTAVATRQTKKQQANGSLQEAAPSKGRPKKKKRGK